MKKILIGLVVLLVAVMVMVLAVSPNQVKNVPYFYVEFQKNLVLYNLSSGTTATLSPPGYLMGIAPHSLVFALPEKGGKMKLIRIYGASASKTIGVYDMPVLPGIQGEVFSTVVYGKTVSDMKVCAISVDGNIVCSSLPSDVSSDMQTLSPQLIKLWYDGKYFYYLGRFIERFGSGEPKQLDDNGDMAYSYVLPLPEHRFVLGGKRISLYDENGFVRSATLSLMPRWISPRMVSCGSTVVVPAGTNSYKIDVRDMVVLKKLRGVPVGCVNGSVLLFKGTYPIKGDIVSEDGKVYLKGVSFGALIGGIRP